MQHLPQLLANIYHYPVGSLPVSTAQQSGFTAAGGGAERKAALQELSHHEPPAKGKQNNTSHRKMLLIKRIPARTRILALLGHAPVGNRSRAWLQPTCCHHERKCSKRSRGAQQHRAITSASPLLISKGLPSLAAWWPLWKAQPTRAQQCLQQVAQLTGKLSPFRFHLRSSRTAEKQQARLLQTCISTGTQSPASTSATILTPPAPHQPCWASGNAGTCAQQP